MTTMIKLTGINKIYRTEEIETQALENVNLEVQKGEFLSIMGPSGCGKSTLLNIMGLLDTPTSGTIEINGTHTENMGDKELAAFRNKTLGFVFQRRIKRKHENRLLLCNISCLLEERMAVVRYTASKTF